jgi:hypothetical protein
VVRRPARRTSRSLMLRKGREASTGARLTKLLFVLVKLDFATQSSRRPPGGGVLLPLQNTPSYARFPLKRILCASTRSDFP